MLLDHPNDIDALVGLRATLTRRGQSKEALEVLLGAASLVVKALAENIGYRQMNSWWSCVATVQVLTGRGGGWGPMRRQAFKASAAEP